MNKLLIVTSFFVLSSASVAASAAPYFYDARNNQEEYARERSSTFVPASIQNKYSKEHPLEEKISQKSSNLHTWSDPSTGSKIEYSRKQRAKIAEQKAQYKIKMLQSRRQKLKAQRGAEVAGGNSFNANRMREVNELSQKITQKADARIVAAKLESDEMNKATHLADQQIIAAKEEEKNRSAWLAKFLEKQDKKFVALKKEEELKRREIEAERVRVQKRKQEMLQAQKDMFAKMEQLKLEEQKFQLEKNSRIAARDAQNRLELAKKKELLAKKQKQKAIAKARIAKEMEDKVAYARKLANRSARKALEAKNAIINAEKQAAVRAELALKHQKDGELELEQKLRELNDRFVEQRKNIAQKRAEAEAVEARLLAAKKKAQEEEDAKVVAQHMQKLAAAEASRLKRKQVLSAKQAAAKEVAEAILNAARTEAKSIVSNAHIRSAEIQEAAELAKKHIEIQKARAERDVQHIIQEAKSQAARKIEEAKVEIAAIQKFVEGSNAKKIRFAEAQAESTIKSAATAAKEKEAEATILAAKIIAEAEEKKRLELSKIKVEVARQSKIAVAKIRAADKYTTVEKTRIANLEAETKRLMSFRIRVAEEEAKKLQERKLDEAKRIAAQIMERKLKEAEEKYAQVLAVIEKKKASMVLFEKNFLAKAQEKHVENTIQTPVEKQENLSTSQNHDLKSFSEEQLNQKIEPEIKVSLSNEELGSIIPAAGINPDDILPASDSSENHKKMGLFNKIINFFSDDNRGGARVQIAEAVRVPVTDLPEGEKIASIDAAKSYSFWLKLGEFDNKFKALEHYYRIVNTNKMSQLDHDIVRSKKIDSSAVSIKIGPVASAEQVSELCMKFRADNLGCSTIALQ